MKLTEKEVRHVAELANLALSDDEIARMTQDLDGILTHIDKLNELDTSKIAPMTQVMASSDPAFGGAEAASRDDSQSTLRDDVERPPLGTALALANAPAVSQNGPGSGYFKVPKVIER